MADTQTGGVTLAGLRERLGQVFDEIFALGRRAGRDEGYKAGLAEGARIERERVRAALSPPLPSQQVPTEKPAGGTQAAQKAPPAKQPAKPSGFLSKIKEVTGRLPLPAAADQEIERAMDPGLSVEERCRADWDREAGLRAEFGTLEAYVAFTRQSEAGARGG